MTFPIGYHRLHPDASINFQMNRWFGGVGEPDMLLPTQFTKTALYFFPWNPIYAGIAAMVLGAIAAMLCRPDLTSNTLIGGVLFLGLYTIFLLGLKWSAPGYIEQVWNLKDLSGIVIYDLPIEECCLDFRLILSGQGYMNTSHGNAVLPNRRRRATVINVLKRVSCAVRL